MKGFLYKDEVFPSPLTQICLQFKGMLNVDRTSPLWVLETINSILLLYSAWFQFSWGGGGGGALGTPYDGVNGDAPPERYPFQVAGI